MTVLKEGMVGGAMNLYFIYKFLRILTTPWENTDAFKLNIIDANGKILIKKSKLKTIEEKESYTMMHRLVWKLKRLMEKVPFGKSRLASYAAALWLIKEEKNFTGTNEELQESFLSFLETNWKNEALILKENYEGDMNKKTYGNLKENLNEADKEALKRALAISKWKKAGGKVDKQPDNIEKWWGQLSPADRKRAATIAQYKKEKKLSKEEVEIDESTKEYAKSLEKIANDRALKMLTKSERENLKKIADLLSKEEVEIDEVLNVGKMSDKKLKDFIGQFDPDERMGQAAAMQLKAARKEAQKRGLKLEEVEKRGIKEEVLEDGTDLIVQKYKEVTPGEIDEKHGKPHPKKKMSFKLKQFKQMKPKKASSKKSKVDKEFAFGISRKGGSGVGSGYGKRSGMMFNGEGTILQITDVDQWSTEIYKGIDAGWRSVSKSTLGGDKNVAIMIKLAIEPEKDWPNKILQNARFAMIRIATDGTMEMFASHRNLKNMRKTKIKSAKDVVNKINTWIKKVDEEVVTEELSTFSKFITEGRGKQGPDAYAATEKDKTGLLRKLIDAQRKHYTEQDIKSIARKYKQNIATIEGGKDYQDWDGEWIITLMNSIELTYDYNSNTTTIRKWKFDKKKAEIHLAKYGSEHETVRDMKPVSGKVKVGGFEAAFELMFGRVGRGMFEEVELDEIAPWKKGNYTVKDQDGKVLGRFKSGAKAQKYVDKIWDEGDYDSLTVEMGEEVVYTCGIELDEEAPANSVAAGNVNLDPFKKKRKNAKVQWEMFGGQKVFVVSPERFYDSRLGKARYVRYEKYVGNDKLGETIRQYGRNNPKNSIILKNSGNGAMLYLKYGRK
jgi:hypothetical protein